jgi:hypothetical protein
MGRERQNKPIPIVNREVLRNYLVRLPIAGREIEERGNALTHPHYGTSIKVLCATNGFYSHVSIWGKNVS